VHSNRQNAAPNVGELGRIRSARVVTPAKAEVQKMSKNLDSGFHRNDVRVQPLLFQASQKKGSYTSGLFDLPEDRLNALDEGAGAEHETMK
jgi:hypothetical protein